ncbi:MAG: C-terminal element, partial [Bacteroidota bacterium]
LRNLQAQRPGPLKWLHAVLQRMPYHPVNRLHELLPLQKNWPELYWV